MYRDLNEHFLSLMVLEGTRDFVNGKREKYMNESAYVIGQLHIAEPKDKHTLHNRRWC